VYRYDDRPNTVPSDPVPMSRPCSYTTTLAAFALPGGSPDWQTLANPTASCAVFGNASYIERTWPLFIHGGVPTTPQPGESNVPFVAIYLGLVQGKT
jgi:hypothetical protein